MKEMNYDEYQQSAIDNIVDGDSKISILSGSGGRGKSTLVNEIITRLLDKGCDPLNIRVCAPTGKASLVVDRMIGTQLKIRPSTVHRMLGFQGHDWAYNKDNPMECEFLVVEESSMVDSALLSRIIYSTSPNTRILLSGDNAQLFPVGAGCPFSDMVIANIPGVINKLVVNYRQKNGEMLADVCERILEGKLPNFNQADFPQEANAFHHEIDDKENVPEELLNIVKPWFEAEDDWIALSPQHKGALGITEMNEFLQEKLNPADDPSNPQESSVKIYDWWLCVGDRVRQTKNNYKLGESGIMNGFVGSCVWVDTRAKKAGIDFGEHEDIIEYGTENLKELVLAYVVSYHAAQGSQYEKVALITHSTHTFMLNRSLLYVGASRARKLLHIVGDMKGMIRGVKHSLKLSRNTYLKLKFSNKTEL